MGRRREQARDVKGGTKPSATPYSDKMVKELLEFRLSKTRDATAKESYRSNKK